MRVIGGIARGTGLLAPHGMLTRPTADRVKEALFNIIQSHCRLAGLGILDICAGSGALGIEALSRGAASCCFVEKNREAIRCLKRNLSATHMTERACILEMDIFKALTVLKTRGDSFAVVFFDPPYSSDLYAVVAEKLSSAELLAPGGLFVAEASARNALPESIGCLVKNDRRVYGDTALEFYVLGDQ